MNEFDEMIGEDVDLEQYESAETNWLGAKDAQGYVLVAMSCNPAKTKYGPKMFLHAVIEGDSEAVEYTISFSEKSAAYAQLQKILDARGADAFPFRFIVEGLGRTFKIGKAPKRQPAGRAKVAEMEGKPISPRPAVKRPAAEREQDEVPF